MIDQMRVANNASGIKILKSETTIANAPKKARTRLPKSPSGFDFNAFLDCLIGME